MMKEREKLNVGMIYSSLVTGFFTILMIVAIILLYIFPPKSFIFQISFTVILSVLAAICTVSFVFLWQTATLDANGILFKLLCFKVGFAKWEEIKKVEIANLSTLESRGRQFGFKWIVVYTDLSQIPKVGGGNFRNKPPWQIKATKKNTNILIKYCRKYRTDLNITTLLSTPQKKK